MHQNVRWSSTIYKVYKISTKIQAYKGVNGNLSCRSIETIKIASIFHKWHKYVGTEFEYTYAYERNQLNTLQTPIYNFFSQ